MDRLRLLDAGLRAFDTSLPGVTPPLCPATRYRAGSCRRCLDVCPAAAIATTPWLTVEPERCSSCGACAAVCPTGALSFAARSAALRERLAAVAAEGGGEATLACRAAALPVKATHASEGDAVVVPCLGGLSAADLIGAATVGIVRLTLMSAGCETCGERAAGLAAGAALDTASAALATLGRRFAATRRAAPRVAADQAPAKAGPALSRRDLFAFVARGARRTAAEGLTPQRRTIAELHGQAPPPAAHARLRADLAALSAPGTTSASSRAALPADLPLAMLEVAPGCTACGLCARYCPHGALVVSDDAPRGDESLCTGCGLCVEVCPPAVLALRPAAAQSIPVAAAGVP